MAGHRRRHAEAGIGVDIGRADEALHQLVGDVIILGQELARDIERNGFGTMVPSDFAECGGDIIQGFIPAGGAAVQHRRAEPVGQVHRVLQRRALDAQPAEIRRMLGIAMRHAIRHRDAATDTAIGAGCARHTASSSGMWI